MLSRYLADIGAPGPGALALSGPWCDLSPGSTIRPSMTANWGTDYIPWLGALSALSAGRHYTLEAREGAYIAPVKATPAEWKYLVGKKVYIHAGTMELLIDEIRITVSNLKKAGVDVTFVEEIGGIHVTPTMAQIFPTSNGWKVFSKDVGPIVNRKY
jgi:acetyl esterase/lipase